MGRRLLTLVGMALAVGLGAPLALAQREPAPQTPAELELLGDVPAPRVEQPATPQGEGPPGARKREPAGRERTKQGQQPPPDLGPPGDIPEPPPTTPGTGNPTPTPAAPVQQLTGSQTEAPNPPGNHEGAPAPLPFVPPDDTPGMEAVPHAGDAPGRDPLVKPSQAPAKPADPEQNPLPPAQVPAGPGAQGQPAPEAAPGGDHFVIPPDRLPLGKQSIALTVDVQSPPFLNLNQEASLKILVKNTGSADAIGVVIRDELPPGLSFLNSQPVAQNAPNDPLLVWRLGTVPAGSERVILVRVKPTKIGPFDHAATVTLEAGSKSRTIVREPKLKVEQTVNSAKVLKGQQVEFKIVVQNTGDGPARNVIVQAKLSAGLRHESGEPNGQNLFERPLDEPLLPGQRVVLEPFVADTLLGGEQSCTVVATSPDVNPGAEEARSTQAVMVVEPKLKMTIVGPNERYTETDARYELAVENPGTATARKVRVAVTLPLGGRLRALPPGAQYDPNSRRLVWSLPQLDPKEAAKLLFEVRMGGVGLYQVAAEAKAEGGLYDKGVVPTNVRGIAIVKCAVTERKNVIDVGDAAVFQVKIWNSGTKEATHLLVSAELSENIKPISTDIESNEQARFETKRRLLVFPPIERLGPGKEMIISIKVEATKPGQAVCRVNLVHDENSVAEKVDSMAAFRVTPSLR